MPLERRGEHRTLAHLWGQAGNFYAVGRLSDRFHNSLSCNIFQWAPEFSVFPWNPTPGGRIPRVPWKSLSFNRLP